MLEVVEQDEQLFPAEEAAEVVARTDRLCDLRGQEVGVGEARERHPEDAVAQRADELRRDLKREARLPGASRPGDGQEARAVRKRRDQLPSSCSLPTRGLAATGRFVASSVLSGGKSPSPSW